MQVLSPRNSQLATRIKCSFRLIIFGKAAAIAGLVFGLVTSSQGESQTVTALLPDTGASQCYQAGSNVLVSCTSAKAIAFNAKQDGMVGRDVSDPDNSDGKLGFSYSAVSGGCVKDNLTGLIWEIKTNDGGLRDLKHIYTNYDDTNQAQKWIGAAYFNPTQAEIDAATNTRGYVASVNAASLCGYTDWRLPTAEELQGIVNYGAAKPSPALDATWFPNTQGNAYWSSSFSAANASDAWSIDFWDGRLDYRPRVIKYHVRLVR